jgi:carboxyl-terminal processing protease
VVLVDRGSASASEIVAGALQDHKVAKLFGETTYGKGSVQRLIPLSSGAMLKVTVARWFTPNGKNITKEGITPDTEVKITEQQLRDGDDVQLDAALRSF